MLTELGGYGAVTTYGNPFDPEFSSGGACNYGNTRLLNYAAAHVDQQSGDGEGMWQGGHACGDCHRVQVGSDTGYRSVVVRITDKCPDAGCGIDLGGSPAHALMGEKPGRYTGKWERVSCEGAESTSDGERVLHVKEGSNAWWSVVQVRNGPSAVLDIQWRSGAQTGNLAWATEAENYWKVPPALLESKDTAYLYIRYRTAELDTLALPGTSLALENSDFPL